MVLATIEHHCLIDPGNTDGTDHHQARHCSLPQWFYILKSHRTRPPEPRKEMVSLYCLTLCLSLLDVVAAATIINVTQDDSPNDSQGRVALSYLGPWSHQQVATCNDADQCPEPFSQTRNGASQPLASLQLQYHH